MSWFTVLMMRINSLSPVIFTGNKVQWAVSRKPLVELDSPSNAEITTKSSCCCCNICLIWTANICSMHTVMVQLCFFMHKEEFCLLCFWELLKKHCCSTDHYNNKAVSCFLFSVCCNISVRSFLHVFICLYVNSCILSVYTVLLIYTFSVWYMAHEDTRYLSVVFSSFTVDSYILQRMLFIWLKWSLMSY